MSGMPPRETSAVFSIRVLRSCLLQLFLLSLSRSYCVAEIVFQPVSPEELKMTSEPLAPGAPAIILFRQLDRDDRAANFSSREDNYLRIKVLTEEGRKFTNVEIPFWKGAEKIVDIQARTVRPDGSVVGFDGKVFEKHLVKARGVEYFANTFTLPDVQVGGIIEYSYRVERPWIYDSSWILSQEMFTKEARFSLKPNTFFVVRMGGKLPRGLAPKMGSDHVIRMEASNIPAFQTEDFMPPASELEARVDFIYSRERFEPDTEKFWRNIGKDWNTGLEHFVGKRKAMEAAVGQIVSQNDPSEVKLRKIYDRVQQIRNTSYELEKTAQEEKRSKEKTAENVEDVWKRGYGDGAEITWLYLALLRAAGFEAYGCWVADRQHYFFTAKTEQSEKLDTNVVMVKLNGKDLYFDPGAAFTSFGLLPWPETRTTGLRLDNDGGTWVQTPLPASTESRSEHKARLRLSEAGDLEGKLTLTYTGLEAMHWRLEEQHGDDVERKELLEDYVKEQVPVTVEAELTNKPDWASSESPLVAEFDIRIPNWVSSAGKRIVLPLGIFSAAEKHLFESTSRVHPIYLEYPFEKVDELTIELPLGWQVISKPPAHNEDGHVVLYSLKVENDKTTLHVTRSLNMDFFLVDQKDYPALHNFFQGVRTGDDEAIVLQPAAATGGN